VKATEIFLLGCEAVPTDRTSDHGAIGGAFVNAWIAEESEEKAISAAQSHIADEGWRLLAVQTIAIVDATSYTFDDPGLEYYTQALLHGHALVFNVWPSPQP